MVAIALNRVAIHLVTIVKVQQDSLEKIVQSVSYVTFLQHYYI